MSNTCIGESGKNTSTPSLLIPAIDIKGDLREVRFQLDYQKYKWYPCAIDS